ncbi:MAG: proline--tRNA ligase [Nitrososphaerales archaeon]|nr:proline--tRNA ligase [Nitrososphaerales archaeon]
MVKIGITEKKDENFSEWYTQTVLKAELIDYSQVKGFIILREYGFSIWENIQAILDKEFKKDGTKNAYFPLLIPESLLNREADHFKGFTPEVFWVTKTGDSDIENKLAIRPTSETIAYESYAKWIKSWRDLPLKLNFWNSVLRAEIKDTKPFIRTSEFLWQEGHTVHETEEDATQQVEFMLRLYKKFVNEYLALPILTGKKSDKEKFVGADYTLTLEGIMPDGKALQMGTSHHLGQNFSKPFEISFLGKDEEQHFAWQTSWGVSCRLMGALIMTHGDDKGLILPPKIAPIQIVIIPIYYDDVKKNEILAVIEDIVAKLDSKNIRSYVDSSDQHTPGWKFNQWEMKGVPIRMEIGPKDLEKNSLVIVKRNSREKKNISINENPVDQIVKELDAMQDELFEIAKSKHDNMISISTDYKELCEKLNKERGFVKVDWCGNRNCEDKVKDETGADIRLIEDENVDSICIVCGKNSTDSVYFAKSY